MKRQLVTIFQSIFLEEGSGVYRLIKFKEEKCKTKFMVTKVYSEKLVAIDVVSCIRGTENELLSTWNTMQTQTLKLTIIHLKNGDIRVMVS